MARRDINTDLTHMKIDRVKHPTTSNTKDGLITGWKANKKYVKWVILWGILFWVPLIAGTMNKNFHYYHL